MRKSKIFLLICLTTIFLIPLIGSARAQKFESYVGIREGQTIIWNTNFDDGPLKDFYEELGRFTEEEIDGAAEYFWDEGVDMDEDTEAIKMIITEIKGEKEYETDIDTYYATKFIYYLYLTEDLEKNDWVRDERRETGRIWKYDSRLYLDMISRTMGLYDSTTSWYIRPIIRWKNLFILDNNVDWDELADKEDDARKYYSNRDPDPVNHFKGSADKEETQFFITKKANGISTSFEGAFPSKLEEFESISKYTDDGILMYYEFSYDGDPIMKIELEGAWLQENWWIVAAIAGTVLIGIVIVIVIIIKKRENK